MSDQARMGSTVLSRRAAVRGAVWALPAVTVATTAPAFANTSGRPAVTELVASYVPGQPEELTVSATVTGFDASYQLALTLPAGVFDSVGSEAASGPASTGLDTSHTLLFTGTTSQFQATLHLGSQTQIPWRGFRGSAFTLSAIAMSGAQQSDPRPAAVPPCDMPNTPLSFEPIAAASLRRLSAYDIAAHPEYAGVIGKIVLVIAVPKVAGADMPETAAIHSAWTRTEVVDGSDKWLYRFTTTQSHHTSRTGPQGGNSDRGPAPDSSGGNHYEFWADMQGMPPSLVDSDAVFNFSVEGDADARFWRLGTITA
ncbi:hypothetical protein IEZ26_02405 [Nocardioides cavernae]|uniref:Uncharacterized protein n=1 Tax=Nocardioides cavernae TaxID=1921566 RepID=A0ABR8N8C5_9ACTN|nr:hypothetical protein [Nocardioides cavernae]MBD3923460.1 hypothetical protein [Nocardioides cavernae]MBM7511614.1 hypothetical protein [Nocardioides cavernae]